MITFHLKDELLVEKESPDARIVLLIAVSFLLGLIDFLGEFIKWLLKKKE